MRIMRQPFGAVFFLSIDILFLVAKAALFYFHPYTGGRGMSWEERLAEKQHNMSKWIEYLRGLEPGELRQENGTALAIRTHFDEKEIECGVCIGAHYQVFKLPDVSNEMIVEIDCGDLDGVGLPSKQLEWVERYKSGENLTFFRIRFQVGVKALLKDLETDDNFNVKGALDECVCELRDKESPILSTMSMWRDDRWSKHYEEDYAPHNRHANFYDRLFLGESWPVEPVKVFELYARRYLGMQVGNE